MAKRKAVTVLGLMFGDEGKGSVVDAIVRREGAGLVVRFNGGPQAAHHVVTADGREHCFAQFGSGTFAGAGTFLSKRVLVDPFALEREAAALHVTDPSGTFVMDASCFVVTPLHAALNKARELARPARHGSCGRGVGETVDFARRNPAVVLCIGDLGNEGATYRKLRALADIMADEWAALGAQDCLALPRGLTTEGFEPTMKMVAELLSYAYSQFHRRYRDTITRNPAAFMARAFADAPVVFEGAQGVLLDEWHGFHPHTTWATTTDAHARDMLAGAGFDDGEIVRVGVLRSYATRHGHGPLPTEGKVTVDLSRDHNKTGAWQGPLRVGAFDCALAAYAIRATRGVDCLAVTHVDQVTPAWPMALGYDGANRLHPTVPSAPGDDRLAWQEAVGRTIAVGRDAAYAVADGPGRFLDAVAVRLGAPVGIVSRGPTAEDKEFRPAYTGEGVTA